MNIREALGAFRLTGGTGGEMLRGVPSICSPLMGQASSVRSWASWSWWGGSSERVGPEMLAVLWNVTKLQHRPPSHYSPRAALNFLIVGPLYTLKNC